MRVVLNPDALHKYYARIDDATLFPFKLRFKIAS